MTSWQIYWIAKLDDIGNMFYVVATISAIASIIIAIAWAVHVSDSYDDEDRNCRKAQSLKKYFLKLIWLPIICFLIASLMPNTKQMAAIILLPKISNSLAANEELKKLPTNLLDLANKWIEELKPKEK